VDRQLSSQFKVILHNQVDLLALVTFHDGSVGDGQARTDQLLDQLDPRGFVPDRHHARSVSSNWLFRVLRDPASWVRWIERCRRRGIAQKPD
jgi:hypothetical protein